ncbi:B3/B4 domain-containing protein [Hahella sp. NBU794]|uniref:B3/B4 domain-containing protein n=1 Tax=Hahella sp. NBU794 TaxID=3422590 RepID=UPI003D6EA4DF
MVDFQMTRAAAHLGLQVVAVALEDVNNKDYTPYLHALRKVKLAQAIAMYQGCDLDSDPHIGGYRRLKESVARSWKRFPVSVENLIGTLRRNGDIPLISPVVDIYNLMSLERRISIGAHDIDRLEGGVRLDITRGIEVFAPLGSEDQARAPVGEFAYLDAADRVLCRMDCRQSRETCLQPSSRRILLIFQGHADMAAESVRAAANSCIDLILTYCGGDCTQRFECLHE